MEKMKMRANKTGHKASIPATTWRNECLKPK
jgi:hypothetical protein